MSNKIQGIILVIVAGLILFNEKLNSDAVIIFSAIVLAGVAIWEFAKNNELSKPLAVKSGEENKLINPEQVALRQEHLQKVSEIAKVGNQITNDEVQKALGVSDKTAERYLQELVGQGKLEQIGESGRQVAYKIKQ